MLHRAINHIHEHHPMMIKWHFVTSESTNIPPTTKTTSLFLKFSAPRNAALILFMAMIIRPTFSFSAITSLEGMNSLSKYRPTLTMLPSSIVDRTDRSDYYKTKSRPLHSSRVDYLSLTEKTITTNSDAMLQGASKTTQLLLQSPQNEKHHQATGESNNENNPEHLKPTPNKQRTLYEILGTTPNATKEELKRQYITLAKLTHPDATRSQQSVNGVVNDVYVDFSDIAAAYHILSNPTERKKYDRTLHSTQMIQMLVLLGDICIGTTLTVAEITTAIVWVTLMIVLQPLAVHLTTELFYLSIDDSSGFSK
jgi:hypothetical protein